MSPSARRYVLHAWPAACLAAASALGCGAGDGLPREQVRGTVTVNGEKLKAGRILFEPKAAPATVTAAAPVQDGSYAIPRDEGLVPGPYIVRITPEVEAPTVDPSVPPGSARPQKPSQPIPEQFNLRSELKADVAAGKENAFDFPLTFTASNSRKKR